MPYRDQTLGTPSVLGWGVTQNQALTGDGISAGGALGQGHVSV